MVLSKARLTLEVLSSCVVREVFAGRFETTAGPLLVATHNGSLCFSQFVATWAEAFEALRRLYPQATVIEAEQPASLFRSALEGAPLTATVPGTPFQLSVWRALTRIPPGATTTYADLARQIGRPRACRAVANACHDNPLQMLVPCHRVVRSDGALGGYAPGADIKLRLLRAEGVVIDL